MTRRSDRVLSVTDEDRSTVELALTDLTHSARVRERLEMMKGAALGWDVAAIAIWSGRTEVTVRRWLKAFAAGGLAALTDAARVGRPVKADATYLSALATAVATSPREVGQAFDVWTSARLSAYLSETTGTRIAPGWLRVLLHQQGFANGQPKHSVAHLQDPTEVAACEERLREAGEKGGRASRPLRTAF